MARTRGEEAEEIPVERVLEAALELFSSQGYGATSMRQIAERSGVSTGNIYHHFGGKERIFEDLLDRYFAALLDPELELNRVFREADFPGEMERLAAAIEEVVDRYGREILLIYVDVIEFGGRHVRTFYEGMRGRFEEIYADRLEGKKKRGEIGDVDPMVAVMVAVRWFFYFFTVEKYFGAPMHFGMEPHQAVHEFIRLLRCGLLPRPAEGCPQRPGGETPGRRKEP